MSQDRSIVQRVLIILSGVAFLGGTVVMGISVMTSLPSSSSAPAEEAAPAEDAEKTYLESQEAGYAAVLEREPENPVALEGLVQTRIELGKLKEALGPLEQLSAMQPDNQEYLKGIAAIYIQTEDYAGAIAPFEQLIELNPNDQELKDQLNTLRAALENGTVETPDE
ncbi:tetratricopeptide repeat protein [Spirulina sp. CCNP1310]|uniref:tetratricopeptide repeat protein n=1 Tax=Spirulina sp. CCNP1310 TaxID=3110249 RepID=UPI002B1EA1E0|nr:tetratricopeptide repeat protein [Spirulina sp. CCNP1310]MEA5420526.1 tetratricopeptide repeat protein [Spirulina sp. CCNP1310]